MKPSLRPLLQSSRPLAGTILSLPAPELAELAALCGFDWLWLDIEHGLFEAASVQRAAMAAGKTPCLARVPANDEIWIKRVLDTGVAGLIVPQVNTPEQAERAASLMRYPPAGLRSAGLGRAAAYGQDFSGYVARANAELVLLVQIEHIQAVENLEAILAVPGVDGVIVGPYDLSASMGLIGQVDAPAVQAQIGRVRQTCLRRGVPLGIFAASPEAGRRAIQQGFQLIALSTDLSTLGAAWRAALAALSQPGK